MGLGTEILVIRLGEEHIYPIKPSHWPHLSILIVLTLFVCCFNTQLNLCAVSMLSSVLEFMINMFTK